MNGIVTVISVLNWKLWKVKLFWLGGKISLQCGYYGRAVQGRWDIWNVLWDTWNWVGEKSRGEWWDTERVWAQQQCRISAMQQVWIFNYTHRQQCCTICIPTVAFQAGIWSANRNWQLLVEYLNTRLYSGFSFSTEYGYKYSYASGLMHPSLVAHV